MGMLESDLDEARRAKAFKQTEDLENQLKQVSQTCFWARKNCKAFKSCHQHTACLYELVLEYRAKLMSTHR